jgi:hypothetical protein
LKNKTQIQTKRKNLRKLMSAIVEVWVCELTKLTEKVLTSNPLLSKSKQGKDQNINKESVSVPPRNNTSVASNSSSTMSEATVCLLMDRFVPW